MEESVSIYEIACTRVNKVIVVLTRIMYYDELKRRSVKKKNKKKKKKKKRNRNKGNNIHTHTHIYTGARCL